MKNPCRVARLLAWNCLVMPIGCLLDLARAPMWIGEYRRNGKKSPFLYGLKEIGLEYADSIKILFAEIKK